MVEMSEQFLFGPRNLLGERDIRGEPFIHDVPVSRGGYAVDAVPEVGEPVRDMPGQLSLMTGRPLHYQRGLFRRGASA